MADDLIRYDVLVQDALRGVVRKVMREVADGGLPGEHHLYIAFDTTAPGVRMSSRLRQQHPEEMTIVLQHQFWDLAVSDHGFEVGLSFGRVPERLLIPFAAVKGFFDPSVQFGLQFDPASPAAAQQSTTAPVLVPPPQTVAPGPLATLPGRPSPVRSSSPMATDQTTRNENDQDRTETDKSNVAKSDLARSDTAKSDTAKSDTAKSDTRSDAAKSDKNAETRDKPKDTAEVVSLDAFRKKP